VKLSRPEGQQHIDQLVGRKIRERRMLLGLTQQQLADMIGVTYQQAHKYERGINRISAGRLFEIAKILSVPVSYFFGPEIEHGEHPRERMMLEIARNFAMIREPHLQEAASALVRAIAGGGDKAGAAAS
jgi:transcriptional regulator with XRE-family HTH domain